MEQSHQLRQLFVGEIPGPCAGVQSRLGAKVDRVGPIFDRRQGALAIPGGRNKLRTRYRRWTLRVGVRMRHEKQLRDEAVEAASCRLMRIREHPSLPA
jgi:hypothetical protein